ncbi:hypothetical protein GOBAR_DD31376 [Gossypium barbadense]|nr:hypothetical protein GOBAR_DD31376 [Gossypium barbadense]
MRCPPLATSGADRRLWPRLGGVKPTTISLTSCFFSRSALADGVRPIDGLNLDFNGITRQARKDLSFFDRFSLLF